jgi:hypothetical protein
VHCGEAVLLASQAHELPHPCCRFVETAIGANLIRPGRYGSTRVVCPLRRRCGKSCPVAAGATQANQQRPRTAWIGEVADVAQYGVVDRQKQLRLPGFDLQATRSRAGDRSEVRSRICSSGDGCKRRVLGLMPRLSDRSGGSGG